MYTQIAELIACMQQKLVVGLMLLPPVPLGGIVLPVEMIARMESLGGSLEAQMQMRTELLFDKSSNNH